jgi:hypothetical protein
MADVGIFNGHLVYFIAFWSTLSPCSIFCDHLVNFTAIWYICPRFGMMCQETSGNPDKKDFSLKLPSLALSAFLQ